MKAGKSLWYQVTIEKWITPAGGRRTKPSLTFELVPTQDDTFADKDPVTGEYLEGPPPVASPLTFYLHDHPGNTRLTFRADGPAAIHLTFAADYFPYGKILRQYAPCQSERFLTTHHERDQDSGYDNRGARLYDSEIGRFLGVDPLASKFQPWSPYNYVLGNPIANIDPDGRSTESTIVKDIGGGKYEVVGGNPNDGDNNIYVLNKNGQKAKDYFGNYEVLGQSITSHSFFGEDDEAIVGAVIDMSSTEGQDFINHEIVATDIGLIDYIANAKGGEPLDFKTRGIDTRAEGVSRQQHVYRGSVTASGKIGSARDFGNIGAGIVSGRSSLISWGEARLGFDGLQSWQEGRLATEGIPTQKAQRVGYSLGERLKSLDSYYSKHGYSNKPSPVKSIQF